MTELFIIIWTNIFTKDCYLGTEQNHNNNKKLKTLVKQTGKRRNKNHIFKPYSLVTLQLLKINHSFRTNKKTCKSSSATSCEQALRQEPHRPFQISLMLELLLSFFLPQKGVAGHSTLSLWTSVSPCLFLWSLRCWWDRFLCKET